MIKTRIFKICIMSLILFFSACNMRFEEVNASTLKKEWDDSIKDSAVSWWYLGEEGDYYYILKEYPLKRNGYRIRILDVKIVVESPHELSFERSSWINLKKGMLRDSRSGLEW